MNTTTAIRMFVRELGRRWPSLLFMVFLPASYFLAMYLISDPAEVGRASVHTGDGRTVLEVNDRTYKSLYLAVLGISVTSAFAAMSTLTNRTAVLRRLRLIGFAPGRLLVARVAVLTLIMLASTAVFTVVLAALISVTHLALVALALLEIAVIGVALGTVLGLVFKREFEASMIIIAICGLQMAFGRSGSSAEQYLPFWPAVEAMKTAAFTGSFDVTRHVVQGAAYAVALFAVAYALWSLRLRVWRPGGRVN